MNPSLRHHLARLDRALLALLNERALLVRELGRASTDARAGVEDVLRRSAGPLDAESVRAVFREVERGCARAAEVER